MLDVKPIIDAPAKVICSKCGVEREGAIFAIQQTNRVFSFEIRIQLCSKCIRELLGKFKGEDAV